MSYHSLTITFSSCWYFNISTLSLFSTNLKSIKPFYLWKLSTKKNQTSKLPTWNQKIEKNCRRHSSNSRAKYHSYISRTKLLERIEQERWHIYVSQNKYSSRSSSSHLFGQTFYIQVFYFSFQSLVIFIAAWKIMTVS